MEKKSLERSLFKKGIKKSSFNPGKPNPWKGNWEEKWKIRSQWVLVNPGIFKNPKNREN